MSIIETAYDSLKRALSDDVFEDARIVAGGGAAIATVRYAHLAGMSLRWVGIGLWFLGCGEPCRTADESFFREIRKVEFDVITTAEVEPIVHGSADEIEAEARAFRRALVRFACFDGWSMEHLNTVITLLLGEDRCLDATGADTMIREELTDVLGRAAA